MKTSICLSVLVSLAAVSINLSAKETAPALLAGVEAGIETDSAMTVSDLEKTQSILTSKVKGAETTWYNLDTTTHYDVTIADHFSIEQRPCVAYKLKVMHNSKTAEQDLAACLNYSGKWIAKLD